MTESLNILLQGPFHPTIWFYVMRSFPEHHFYLKNPVFGCEGERSIPGQEDLYHVYKGGKDIDVQVICIHLLKEYPEVFRNIMLENRFPIVWFQNWDIGTIPNPPDKVYPLIYTAMTNHSRDYPLKRHVWVAPHPYYWRQEWIGDEEKVFAPVHIWLSPTANEVLSRLPDENKIVITGRRTVDWEKWQSYFIHSRVLLDISVKHSSTLIAEALTVGLPLIVEPVGDTLFMVRNGIDGQYMSTPSEVYCEIMHMLKDYDYARQWSERAKKRARELFSVAKTRQVFQASFEDAMAVGPF